MIAVGSIFIEVFFAQLPRLNIGNIQQLDLFGQVTFIGSSRGRHGPCPRLFLLISHLPLPPVVGQHQAQHLLIGLVFFIFVQHLARERARGRREVVFEVMGKGLVTVGGRQSVLEHLPFLALPPYGVVKLFVIQRVFLSFSTRRVLAFLARNLLLRVRLIPLPLVDTATAVHLPSRV